MVETGTKNQEFDLSASMAALSTMRQTQEVDQLAADVVQMTINTGNSLSFAELAAATLRALTEEKRAYREFGRKAIDGMNQFFATTPYTISYLFPYGLPINDAARRLRECSEDMIASQAQLLKVGRRYKFDDGVSEYIETLQKTVQTLPMLQWRYSTLYILKKNSPLNSLEGKQMQLDLNEKILFQVHESHEGGPSIQSRGNIPGNIYEAAVESHDFNPLGETDLYATEFNGISYKQLQEEENSEQNYYRIMNYIASIPHHNALWQRFVEGAFFSYTGHLAPDTAHEAYQVSDQAWNAVRKNAAFMNWLATRMFEGSYTQKPIDPAFDARLSHMVGNLDAYGSRGLGMGMYAAIVHSFYYNIGVETGQAVPLTPISKAIIDETNPDYLKRIADDETTLNQNTLVESHLGTNWPRLKADIVNRIGDHLWSDMLSQMIDNGAERKTAINFFLQNPVRKAKAENLDTMSRDLHELAKIALNLFKNEVPQKVPDEFEEEEIVRIPEGSLTHQLGMRSVTINRVLDERNIVYSSFTTDDPDVRITVAIDGEANLISISPPIYGQLPGIADWLRLETVSGYFEHVSDVLTGPKRKFDEIMAEAMIRFKMLHPDADFSKNSAIYLQFLSGKAAEIKLPKPKAPEIERISPVTASRLMDDFFNQDN